MYKRQEQKGLTHLLSDSKISIAEIFKNVNPETDARFLKYVPDNFLNAEQKAGKERALNEQREAYARYGSASEGEANAQRGNDPGIKHSRRENFGKQIDRLSAGTLQGEGDLYVMDAPEALQSAGADRLPIMMTQANARAAMKGADGGIRDRRLTRTGMRQLPNALANAPLVISTTAIDVTMVL